MENLASNSLYSITNIYKLIEFLCLELYFSCKILESLLKGNLFYIYIYIYIYFNNNKNRCSRNLLSVLLLLLLKFQFLFALSLSHLSQITASNNISLNNIIDITKIKNFTLNLDNFELHLDFCQHHHHHHHHQKQQPKNSNLTIVVLLIIQIKNKN